MFDRNTHLQQLKKIKKGDDFEALALNLFRFQAENNLVYKAFLDNLSVDVTKVKRLEELPFLPIDFFKTQKVMTGNFDPEVVFESSGTTSENTSKHYLKDTRQYLEHSLAVFKTFYGSPEDYTMLALLPSYLERQNSSLVFMVEQLIEVSNNKGSGFYLDDYDGLIRTIKNSAKPVVLFGVTFALLDLVERFDEKLPNTIIIETGGMKGRRKELTRAELHQELRKLSSKAIHSEYGMTELLSQAYALGGEKFTTPFSMKFFVRELHDPFAVSSSGTGILNVVDLANVDSCAFIATQDLAKIDPNGSAEILGRVDNSDIRGCNLLVV